MNIYMTFSLFGHPCWNSLQNWQICKFAFKAFSVFRRGFVACSVAKSFSTLLLIVNFVPKTGVLMTVQVHFQIH